MYVTCLGQYLVCLVGLWFSLVSLGLVSLLDLVSRFCERQLVVPVCPPYVLCPALSFLVLWRLLIGISVLVEVGGMIFMYTLDVG